MPLLSKKTTSEVHFLSQSCNHHTPILCLGHRWIGDSAGPMWTRLLKQFACTRLKCGVGMACTLCSDTVWTVLLVISSSLFFALRSDSLASCRSCFSCSASLALRSEQTVTVITSSPTPPKDTELLQLNTKWSYIIRMLLNRKTGNVTLLLPWWSMYRPRRQ